MNRAVLDTNILVSALLRPGGNEAAVVDLVATGALIPCVSAPILAEYLSVLHRPSLGLNTIQVEALLAALQAFAVVVAPNPILQVSPDPADNRFLECAEAAGAHFLITGNRRHLPHQWKATEILNSGELLARLR